VPHVEPWWFRWQMVLPITLPVFLLALPALFLTWEVGGLLPAALGRLEELLAQSADQRTRPVSYTGFVEAARQLGVYWLALNRALPQGGLP
jgi:hypothetical protein